MRPHNITLALAAVLVTGSLAIPAPQPIDEDGALDYSEEGDEVGAILNFEAPDTETTEEELTDAPLFARDGAQCKIDSNIICDDKNKGSSGSCQNLKNWMNKNLGQKVTGQQLCDQGGDCCIKWSKDLGEVKVRELRMFAMQFSEKCQGDSVSAMVKSVPLAKGCVSVCMTNGVDCPHEAVEQ